MTKMPTAALLTRDDVRNRALRQTEIQYKRLLFQHEDRSVQRLQRDYRTAYARLVQAHDDIAARYGVRTLDNDVPSQNYRDAFMQVVQEQAGMLTSRVAADALRAVVAAWYAGYYLKLYQLDMVTRADVRIAVRPPDAAQIARQTIQRMREDVYDEIITTLLGREWRDLYAMELDEVVLRIRRTISRGMGEGLGISDIMRMVRDELGIDMDRRRGPVGSAIRAGYRANFNRIQAITRTVVNQASNNGAIEAYRANRDIVVGYQWLAARDERTCPTCRKLNGTTYRLRDTFRPPAHPNCRCTLIPVLDTDMTIPDTGAPRTTYGEWLQEVGAVGYLTDFFQGY